MRKDSIEIRNIRIVKRTFEGINDSSKNDNILTSKFFPSQKYAVLYERDDFDNPIMELAETEKDAKQTELELNDAYNN